MRGRKGTVSHEKQGGVSGHPSPGVFLAVLLLASSAAAQNANWNGGAGNWNNINNWDCKCIPGAGFIVTNVGGDITLDTNTSIAYLLGTGGSLTLNSHALTATDPLGIQMTGGLVSLSNSSVINGSLIANNLQAQSSTINGAAQAFDANIINGATGNLTIDSQLTASNSTFGSHSSLTISAASSISNSTIGGQFNINGGSLTVDAGSTISATQTAIISGGLTIQGGSVWNQSSTPVFLGLAPGSASVDVTGTGSTLNLTNTALELGEFGNSTATVEHGGAITATGSGGDLLIGLGAALPTDSAMYVNSGGVVSANQITVSGATNGSTGLLSLSDSPSRVTATGQLVVNDGGVVNAANQSSLNANSLTIINGSSVTIDSGASLTLASNNVALVGSLGNGTLTFQGGGTGSGPGELVLGGSGASGTVVITGVGSAWHGTNSVSVGELGAGSLSVSSGALLETGADANGVSGSIGTQSSGTGTVTIHGGDWQAGGTVQVGAAGSGTLNLQQSGTVESGAAVLAVNPGSAGSATVTDAGSKWTITGNLTVGSGGNASLTISNGGQVSNGDATIGELASSISSSVSVSGAGSRWVNSGALTVGGNGTGSLFISAGGVVTNVDGTIGDKKGSNGSVTVIGLGSSWQNSGLLTVGGDGAASLTVDTGSVLAGGAGIGSNYSPVQVTITNHGSLTVLGDVSIGGAGTTSVTVENGATFDSGDTATIGGSGGDATVTVTGADSAWTLHGLRNLTVDDNGSLFVTDGATVTAATIDVLSGGLLNGQDGNIVGSIMNQGGTVTAGDAVGTLSITGNYTQTSGGLLFEIDGLGPTQFDRLLVSGAASVTGGFIDIEFGNGFAPAAGESFDLISAGQGLTLAGVTFDVIGLPPGVQYVESIGTNGFSLGFTPASQATPEPAAGVLLGLGLAVVLLRRSFA